MPPLPEANLEDFVTDGEQLIKVDYSDSDFVPDAIAGVEVPNADRLRRYHPPVGSKISTVLEPGEPDVLRFVPGEGVPEESARLIRAMSFTPTRDQRNPLLKLRPMSAESRRLSDTGWNLHFATVEFKENTQADPITEVVLRWQHDEFDVDTITTLWKY